MSPLAYTGIFLAVGYIFWLHYLIYSAYREAILDKRVIPTLARVLVSPLLLVFGLMDIIFNVLIGWIAFGEAPLAGWTFNAPSFLDNLETWGLTNRCDRHLDDSGWRGKLARFLCSQFLDPFQTGGHCKGCK